MKDPYESLGLVSICNRQGISKHSDAGPQVSSRSASGRQNAEAKFKDISAAHDLLKDKEKRRRFDAGEIDASGPNNRRSGSIATSRTVLAIPHTQRRTGLPATKAWKNSRASLCRRRRTLTGEVPGAWAGCELCAAGCVPRRSQRRRRTITLPEGKTLQVTIPEGSEDRQMLRLKEQGMPGYDGGPAGDAYVELHIEPHPYFSRKDDDIHVDVPVTLNEAMLGAQIEVPTIKGQCL